jgi:hypothetical protein
VQTLVNFLEALIISWIIVYATYGLVLLAMRSVWWTARFASWIVVYATFGVMLLVVHAVSRTFRWVSRFSQGSQWSRAGSAAAVSLAAVGGEAKSMPAPRMRPSFPDVAISVREASEALFAYERRVFGARSEIRETVTRTLDTIDQTRALMARVDAAATGNNGGYAASMRH